MVIFLGRSGSAKWLSSECSCPSAFGCTLGLLGEGRLRVNWGIDCEIDAVVF
jgi:hypothetical protein